MDLRDLPIERDLQGSAAVTADLVTSSRFFSSCLPHLVFLGFTFDLGFIRPFETNRADPSDPLLLICWLLVCDLWRCESS